MHLQGVCKQQKSDSSMATISFPSALHGVKCVLYELLPVHPAYAYKHIMILKKIIIQSTKIISYKSFELSVFLVKVLATVSAKTWLKMALWASLWKLFIYIEFGSLFIIVSLFAAVFGNLGQKEAGDLSGYSVFNKGFKTLLGQSTGQQFDNEIRHNFKDENDDDGHPANEEPKIKPQKGV